MPFLYTFIAFETTLAEGNRLEKRLFHTTFGLVSSMNRLNTHSTWFFLG